MGKCIGLQFSLRFRWGSRAEALLRKHDRKTRPDLVVDGGGDVFGARSREYLLYSMPGIFDQARSAGILPFQGALAVSDFGIDVVFLHEIQGLVVAEEVAGPIEADASHGFKGEGLVIDLDTP